MTKLDFEVREFKFKERLNEKEYEELIIKMRNKGFDFEGFDFEREVYSFVKFYK